MWPKCIVFLFSCMLSATLARYEDDFYYAVLRPPTLQASDFFGRAVAISTDAHWAIIGAPNGNFISTVKNVTNTGIAFVYYRQGTEWALVATLYPDRPLRGAEFGRAVAVDGTGRYFAVGTFQGDSTNVPGSGNAYVFYRQTDEWGVDSWIQTSTVLEADNPGPDDKFGSTIAMGDTGEWIAVGAYACCHAETTAITDMSGAVYIFRRTKEGPRAQYSFVQRLTPPAQYAQRLTHYGQALAMSSDSLRVVVGSWAQGYSSAPNAAAVQYAGSAFIWTRTTELAINFVFEQKLIAPTPTAIALFGCAVAIDGDRVAIGARNHNAGDPRLLAAGVVYIFERNATQPFGQRWYTPLRGPEYLRRASPVSDEKFGNAVALSGDWLYVGTYDNSRATASQVYTFYYNRTRTKWVEVSYLLDSSGEPPNIAKFGYSLAVGGYYVITGAPNDLSSHPNNMGYGIVSIARAYLCSGHGTVGALDAQMQGICKCDQGYYPGPEVVVTGQALALCSECDRGNGYFPTSAIGPRDCRICSGHGSWVSNASGYGCVCDRGWALAPDLLSGRSCTICDAGFQGDHCRGRLALSVQPLTGIFLQDVFTLRVTGVDVSNPPKPAPTFEWYWRKKNSTGPLFQWQPLSAPSNATTTLTIAASEGLPVGTVELRAVEVWRGQQWADVVQSITVQPSSDVSDFMDQLTGFSLRLNPTTGKQEILYRNAPMDTTDPNFVSTVLNRFQTALDKVETLEGEGYSTGQMSILREDTVNLLKKVVDASEIPPCNWLQQPFDDYTALLNQILKPGQISNSGNPSVLDLLMGMIGSTINCAGQRPKMNVAKLEEVLDSAFATLYALSRGNVTKAGRREGDQGVPQYKVARDWVAMVAMVSMNQTVSTSYSWRGTKSNVEVQARRVAPTQPVATIFLTDATYGQADVQLSTLELTGFKRDYVDLVAMTHPNPLSDSTDDGLRVRVSPLVVYGLYNHQSQPMSTQTEGTRVQLKYDPSRPAASSQYCPVYVAQQFNGTAWLTVAGCDQPGCTTWTISPRDPGCPDQSLLSGNSTKSNTTSAKFHPLEQAPSKFQTLALATCPRLVNPNIKYAACLAVPPFIPLAVFMKNAILYGGAPVDDGLRGYKWDKGLILAAGYAIFYGLALIISIWGIWRDRQLRRKLVTQPPSFPPSSLKERLVHRLVQHTWAAMFIRKPGEVVAIPQRVAILTTGWTVVSCIMFISMPWAPELRTLAAMAPIAAFGPLAGWAPTMLMRWIFTITYPCTEGQQSTKYQPSSGRPDYFARVQLEAESDPTRTVTFDEKGKLEATKGGANPYLKVIQQEKLRKQNQGAIPHGRSIRAHDVLQQTNPLAKQKPTINPLARTTNRRPSQQVDASDDDDEEAPPVVQNVVPSRPSTAKSERSVISHSALDLEMQDTPRQHGGVRSAATSDSQAPPSGPPPRQTVLQFVVGRVVELAFLGLAIGLPFAGNAPWHWPLWWGTTVASLAVAGALYVHGLPAVSIILLYLWSLGMTAWVLAGVFALPPLYYVIPLCLTIPMALLAVIFVYRTLKRPFNAIMSYVLMNAVCVAVALLIAVASINVSHVRTNLLIGAVTVVLAYPAAALLVVVRLRYRVKGRLLPVKVPRRARFVGFPFAFVICVVSLAVVGWHAAREAVDYSALAFVAVVLIGMAIDILFWEFLKALVLVAVDYTLFGLKDCGCLSAMRKVGHIFGNAFLG